jgi:hypothetical protein
MKVQSADATEMKPVYTEDGVTYMYIKVCVCVCAAGGVARRALCHMTPRRAAVLAPPPQHNSVYLLAVSARNSNVAMMLLFLSKLCDILVEYLGELEEESIRDNFIIIYELLDEVMDYGYPQVSETRILRECVRGRRSRRRRRCTPAAVLTARAARAAGTSRRRPTRSSGRRSRRRPSQMPCRGALRASTTERTRCSWT